MLITAIDRDHQVLVPGGSDDLRVGDEIFVLGEPKAIAGFEKKIGGKQEKARNVVVFGGSGLSQQVCQQLQRDHVDVRVIVEDREEAERLSEVLKNNVVVLHADATDLNFLQEEHVGDADAFLGISDEDERNLMSCQLSKSLGVQRTVALVQKPDYVSLYQRLGIDIAVSPRLLCANRILAFVRSRSISTIATIEEGKAEVLEVELPAGSALVGKKLKEAGFPRGLRGRRADPRGRQRRDPARRRRAAGARPDGAVRAARRGRRRAGAGRHRARLIAGFARFAGSAAAC